MAETPPNRNKGPMLDNLRKGAAKVMGTLLFLVLILSFALWGIPNYTRDVTSNTIATVGGAQLTADDYRRFTDEQLQQLSLQAGRRLTRENARLAYRIQQFQQGNFNADLDRDLLGFQINQMLLEEKAKAMGLAMSDEAIVEAIRSDPQYQGPDKKFSREIFDEKLRQTGLTEAGYFRERRSSGMREQILRSLVSGLAPSKAMIDILHQYQEEKRTISWFTLDATKLPKIADPDEAKLKEQFEASKRQFVAPETRKIMLLKLTREAIRANAKVTDAEVKAAWEKDPESWHIPERRRVQQIVCKTMEECEGVAKEIAGGKSFLMAALETNGARGRLDQGLLSRAGIPDPKVAAAVFSLPVDKLSEPIEARGGVLLLRVTEIEPAKQRTFDEVAKEVREGLEQVKEREAATRLHEQIEDLRGAGKSLKEIGESLKFEVKEIPSIDKTGRGADGKPAIADQEASRMVASAFDGPKEVPRDPIELSDGTEAWIEVLAITPQRDKTLEEVKDEVKRIWIEAETRKALARAADDLVAKIKAGTSLEDAAKSISATVEKSEPFTRSGGGGKVPPTAIRQAFTLAKGAAGTAETADGKSRVVFVVTEISPAPAPTAEEAEKRKQGLAFQLQNDAQALYVQALRQQIGVTIDEAAYKRATGTDQPK